MASNRWKTFCLRSLCTWRRRRARLMNHQGQRWAWRPLLPSLKCSSCVKCLKRDGSTLAVYILILQERFLPISKGVDKFGPVVNVATFWGVSKGDKLVGTRGALYRRVRNLKSYVVLQILVMWLVESNNAKQAFRTLLYCTLVIISIIALALFGTRVLAAARAYRHNTQQNDSHLKIKRFGAALWTVCVLTFSCPGKEVGMQHSSGSTV